MTQTASGPEKDGSKVEAREIMDVRQAANYLGISPDTLYQYAQDRTLPAFRLGNRWRFRKLRLDEWMDRQSESKAFEK
jgi:excisionase family DNA binding protein